MPWSSPRSEGDSHDDSNYNGIATEFPLFDWWGAIIDHICFYRGQGGFAAARSPGSWRYISLPEVLVDIRRRLTTTDLTSAWSLIRGALTSLLLTRPLCSTSRSAQGFLTVPLCSLLKDGNIDELFRLHAWLPDRQRGNPELAIHSHQPFGQSWILAGIHYSYKVAPAPGPEVATHAEHVIAWDDSKKLDSTYKAHQTSCTVKNTQTLVCLGNPRT